MKFILLFSLILSITIVPAITTNADAEEVRIDCSRDSEWYGTNYCDGTQYECKYNSSAKKLYCYVDSQNTHTKTKSSSSDSTVMSYCKSIWRSQVEIQHCYDTHPMICLLYTSPSPRDGLLSRMPSSA